MNDKNDELAILGAMFRWVSDVFYSEPTNEILKFVRENISMWPDSDSDCQPQITEILTSIEIDGLESIKRDFYRLFIGPGKKEVYPWGSVYTDKENLLFGDTTVAWEHFCNENSIAISLNSNEPTDHFALIFSAIAAVLDSSLNERNRILVVKSIYNDHFSPWGAEVLSLIAQKSKTNYYKCFSQLALKLIHKIEAL